ncbi:PAS domain-containing sensor histidine kinase [Thermosynechococcaceae cyanobacterium BACA0444]|uniref:histidine kinase n=1 Tax=Pseudocalidococcus azoricus BACA0444 TaxID=2918990 RepID=A0AAE4JY64_9CYAN|nr:PAS domain-containing sensor histidine kinase [Pseudocalidococcus azoricus]MDS3859407.1 PAS domain-containing sensor histidine kinase [Pseudocalidococcus azoricus BACA0444]
MVARKDRTGCLPSHLHHYRAGLWLSVWLGVGFGHIQAWGQTTVVISAELGFFLGLGLGLVFYGIASAWQRQQWLRVLKEFNVVPVRSPLPVRLRTILKNYQAQIAHLEAKILYWQNILDQAPVSYIEVDQDCLCQWSNQSMANLLGTAPQPGRLLIEVVRSYELDCLVDDVQTTQVPCQREWLHSVLKPSGQTQRLPLRGLAIPLPHGHVGVFLENRQEVKILRDERDRWASDVAHELKTPLTSLRLVAETLQQRVDPNLRSWVDRLLAETVRLSLLVQELLELNRLSLAPVEQMERQSLDLVALLQRAWSNLDPLASPRQISLNYVGPSQLLYWGNEAQLFRLLMNLLDNGIKYSPPAQAILARLELTPPTGQRVAGLRLEIIDHGPGFIPQDLPYIFDRFFRSDPARSRSPLPLSASTGQDSSGLILPISSGSGLGLAIAEQIVDCHQGQIFASNDPITGGAAVAIWLPQTLTPTPLNLSKP